MSTYTVNLYTSSLTASMPGVARTTLAMASSSARANTLPVGLCGELTMMALVRGVTAARSASASRAQPSAPLRVSDTYTAVPPAAWIWPA